MIQNTPETNAEKSNGYPYYRIGIEGQMEHSYGNDVENNPGFAIECLMAHVTQIVRHYAKKRNISYEDARAVDLLVLVKADPTVAEEMRLCEEMILRARKNLEALLGVPAEETPLVSLFPAESELSE